MKEKRIMTMFITSAIALVVSLVVTFGIVLTLADPVEATGLTRYAFSFGGTNNALIAEANGGYKLATDVIYTPSGSIVWKELSQDIDDDNYIVNAQPDKDGKYDYTTKIMYGDEAYSSKIKVLPFRLSNDTNATKTFNLKVIATGDQNLMNYTTVKVFDYEISNFESRSLNSEMPLITLDAGEYRDFIVVVYTDDATNFGEKIAYGNGARLNLNLFIK